MTERMPLLKAGDIGSRDVVRMGLWWSGGLLAPGWGARNAGFEEAKELLTLASERHPELVRVYAAVTQDEGREL